MYLPLLRDLTRVHRYSWGSACLANLYREMCRATKPNAKAMGGCLTLLQSWAWYRLPFLAPIVNRLPTYPFASRWGQKNLSYRGIPRGDLTAYRSRLDRMDLNDVIIILFKSCLIKLTQCVNFLTIFIFHLLVSMASI
ncbi:putative protein-serine/threonine phosphatase [Lupinus albus]|uniref:Aminotransferase-like plant mobile domain-containing protein n=1 Tax=Lupinus albus TaxID=3870 RepID=A0A6A4QTF5_LUPAL|nr:putative protein-serine/threonine phosphatase [Lupinus albus]